MRAVESGARALVDGFVDFIMVTLVTLARRPTSREVRTFSNVVSLSLTDFHEQGIFSHTLQQHGPVRLWGIFLVAFSSA